MAALTAELTRVLTEISMGVIVIFFQGGAHRYADGFRIKPPVEFAPSINAGNAPLLAYIPLPIRTNSLRASPLPIKPQGESVLSAGHRPTPPLRQDIGAPCGR